jgi:hypothetical protein
MNHRKIKVFWNQTFPEKDEDERICQDHVKQATSNPDDFTFCPWCKIESEQTSFFDLTNDDYLP